MKVFPEDPAFSIGEVGFDSVDAKGRKLDVLARKPLGQRLTDLVDRIDQPLVIALDGGWGSGKSHFLKLWTGAHHLELGGKAEVIYFDAFEHDYLDDPLVSLVARLTSEEAEKTWGEMAVSVIKKKAFPLVELAARLGLAAATQGATELVGVVGDKVIERFGEAGDAAIEEFWKAEGGRIAAMQGFRQALTDLTKAGTENGAPRKIVFIVDELDRCRPDYALTLLEIIKHFFAVPNVHFVLGANLDALGHSVSARYGSGIDAPLYLQKFIHLKLTFPQSSGAIGKADNALLLLDYFAEEVGLRPGMRNEMIDFLTPFCTRRGISLRDVQRLVPHLVLLPSGFEGYYSVIKEVILTSLLAKILSPGLYVEIRSGTIELEKIEAFLLLALPISDETVGIDSFAWRTWAYLLQTSPPPELVLWGQQRFGGLGLRDKRNWLVKTVQDILETITIPQNIES